jgi:hypothetical protein
MIRKRYFSMILLKPTLFKLDVLFPLSSQTYSEQVSGERALMNKVIKFWVPLKTSDILTS